MITFTLGIKNAPPGTAWWVATWYEPPNTWYSGWMRPTEKYVFSGVSRTGWLYVTAYDNAYKVLANFDTWGRFTFEDRREYTADFATRSVVGVVPPPEVPPPPVIGEAEFKDLEVVFS